MKNCPNLQKSLDWCEGMPQLPGIRRRVYFCNKNLIVAYPTLTRNDFGRVTDAKYVGAFELAENAYWQYIDVNIDKSTVTSEPQGEVPSQTQLNKATFVHNGIDDEATAAAGFLNNSDCVIVYEDMRGHFRVLGNNKWRTLITVAQDQGQGTNPASTTINVEVTDVIAPPFYTEGLETEDGLVFPHANNSAIPEPRLTSPTGSTFDIGTVKDSASTISKQMLIKGADLTQPLTLTKTGSGLTISKSSISAAEANAGVYVTLTYTKSTTGAGSLNGSLRIYSTEVDKTVTVTAKKAALTSPSASSIDVGTIASDGSSVQKSITIQGSNLSKAVSLRVTGSGFSLSKSSLSASQVNNGAAVIIYYTNASQGAASATGSLIISSDEVSKTIELTAAKEAASVDTIDDYVHKEDLLLHLDGINKGGNADAWTDLIEGLVFPNHGATAEEKGWDLDGQDDWLGYDATSYNLPFNMENCTIEVCFYDKAINQGTGVPGSTAFLCSFGSQSDVGSNQTNGAYVNLCDSSNKKYINGCYLDGSTNVYEDTLIDKIEPNTLSINKSNALHNGQALSSLGTNHWANVKGGRLIGVQNHGSNRKQNYFNGKIYAIRVYNRILTPAEMLHNQHVDNIRFSLGLTLPEEEDDDSV